MIISWNIFLLANLIKNIRKLTAIHAIDLDTFIPAFIVAKIFGIRLIAEVYDKYSDSRPLPKAICNIADFIEFFILKNAKSIILPDTCRINQLALPEEIDKKIFIIENVPNASLIEYKKHAKINRKIKLSYVGILEEKHRGIEDLIKSVSKSDNFELIIAGDGSLRSYIISAAALNANIKYIGPVKPDEALAVMSSSDIIVGLYYRTIKNHYFASPNKYYEHLLLGRPLLTTKNTRPGVKVTEYNTGFAIEEGEASLDWFLEEVTEKRILLCGENARTLWEKVYKNYHEHIRNSYIKAISIK